MNPWLAISASPENPAILNYSISTATIQLGQLRSLSPVPEEVLTSPFEPTKGCEQHEGQQQR